jgi:hypothetical protein
LAVLTAQATQARSVNTGLPPLAYYFSPEAANQLGNELHDSNGSLLWKVFDQRLVELHDIQRNQRFQQGLDGCLEITQTMLERESILTDLKQWALSRFAFTM